MDLNIYKFEIIHYISHEIINEILINCKKNLCFLYTDLKKKIYVMDIYGYVSKNKLKGTIKIKFEKYLDIYEQLLLIYHGSKSIVKKIRILQIKRILNKSVLPYEIVDKIINYA